MKKREKMEVEEKLLKLVFDSLLNQGKDPNLEARLNFIKIFFVESDITHFVFFVASIVCKAVFAK